ncbi:MAG: M20/M25/M40 family metallo-hydrolase, partial [candidate division WOR-3 bacterium]
KRFEKNSKYSLVATFKDTKKPKIFFVGHLDVVDAKDELFEPKVEGNIIRGRGAIDMKGPCAVLIELFKELSAENKNYDIGLMLTTDEEIGSENGVNYLLNEEGYSCDFAIIPDGGFNFNIINREKGVLHFRVISEGKSAHGSRVWEGLNAIDNLIDFYNDISLIFPSEPCGDPNHWHNTINIGKIQGGLKVNIVPDYAIAEIDIRFTEPWTVETMKEQVLSSIKKFPNLKFEVLSTGEAIYVPEDNEFLKLYKQTAEKILNRKVEFISEHGATDGRFFAQKGIPVIITNAIGYGLHTDEEWVDLESLYTLKEIFKSFLNERADI